jgi:hypothetical protein
VDDDEHQIGYKVLPKGTPVITTDGVTIGTVAKVLDNEREHIFDGIVVKTDAGRVFVDAPEVERIYARRGRVPRQTPREPHQTALLTGAGVNV